MIKLYSETRARQIVQAQDAHLEALGRRYPLPAACIRAILFKELLEIDLLDVAADLAVRFYWARYGLRRWLRDRGIVRSPQPVLRWGPFGKRDSSTGYAQIFAYVGIRAINFALDRGLAAPGELRIPADRRLSPETPEDLREIWYRLYRDTRCNTELAALNLLAAAEEMTGRVDFFHYTPEELMLVFTRYNADTRHITAYGREAYGYYLAYSRGETPRRGEG